MKIVELNCRCLNCEKRFYKKPSKILANRGKFCCRACKSDYKNMPETRERMLARFWSHVEKTDGCWIYAGVTYHSPFYRRPVDGGPIGAHVFSFLIHHGKLPDGHIVRHKCDVGGCVHPDHLLSGTHKDNSQDASSRGRSSYHKAKLTRQDVENIRAQYKKGVNKQKDIASEYGVHFSTIQRILSHETWRHV